MGDPTGTQVSKEEEGNSGVECPLCAGTGLVPGSGGEEMEEKQGNPAPAFSIKTCLGGLHPSQAPSQGS